MYIKRVPKQPPTLLYHALADEATKAEMSLYTFVAKKLKSTVPTVQEDTD